MADTATHTPNARHSVPLARTAGWRLDYAICTCPRDWDDCPHCGLGGSDAHPRGRCHARSAR